MLNNHEYIARLIGGHNNGSLSENEQRELNEWVEASQANRSLFNELSDPDQIREYLREMDSYDEERGWEKIHSIHPFSDTPVRKLFTWKRIAVAASILLAVSLGGYFLLRDRKASEESITKTDPQTNDVKAPETNRAVITLADGRIIALDSINSLDQGTVKLTRTADGKIVYTDSRLTAPGSRLVFNTLTNPRGSKVIDMTLADGSHVWLNAGSSVTYPVAFIGNERRVSITGEAYFEVAHDIARPFYVSKEAMLVQVLGTKFNVNAYDDEADIKVTLLEGSVKVSANEESLTIKPNQQAIIAKDNAINLNISVDVGEVMAWKNGLFSFDRADIQSVMREIARWYNVEVRYEGTAPAMKFGGKLQRNLNLSQVLKALEKSEVRFKVEDRTITVMR